MSNIIELKEINKLVSYDYFIPTYQRGYRWTEQQVLELLNDIYEFLNIHNDSDKSFYCLQPIVVKKREDGRFDVIDGQQRLTTFLIIQKYLNLPVTYHIEYATRPGSSEYLDNIVQYVESNKELTDKNIDYYYMANAFTTTKKWFEDKIKNLGDVTLTAQFSYNFGKFCKVIWYEVDDTANAESIFTRLNIGKIPLTNAELIKALFLRKSNFVKENNSLNLEADTTYLRQLEIASQWDEMENTLQDDKVWYFINPKYETEPATRIEYIFDIIAPQNYRNVTNGSFVYFMDLIETIKIEDAWKIVKDHYRLIMEWYNDQKLFHLIGFLTSSRSKITVEYLVRIYFYLQQNKNEFLKNVTLKVQDYFNNINIESLTYEDRRHHQMLKDVLLLFNVVTVMNKSNSYSRFPFDLYNSNKNAWSLEHIHAQSSDGIGKSKDVWLQWIDEHLESFRSFTDPKYRGVVESLESVDRDKLDRIKFDELFKRISEIISDDYGEDLHQINNLALLDTRSNSSISNNFFDVKRKMILEKDRRCEFIPVCTRNVFLKYYSLDPSHIHYWSESDRTDYLNEIKRVIKPYFPQEEQSEEKSLESGFEGVIYNDMSEDSAEPSESDVTSTLFGESSGDYDETPEIDYSDILYGDSSDDDEETFEVDYLGDTSGDDEEMFETDYLGDMTDD